jgi:hypothetical protein
MTHPELRSELLSRMERDQSASQARDYDTLDAVNRDNRERMKQIVAMHGWPGWSMVGVDGAFAAWLLVQHADFDVGLQKTCLALLRESVAAGDAEGSCAAYLEDRVAVNENRKQIYGTQFGDDREPRPIEDEANVDARRASVGLEPLADYRRKMWELYGPPQP